MSGRREDEDDAPYALPSDGSRWRIWPSIPGKWTFTKRDDGSWIWKRIDEEAE